MPGEISHDSVNVPARCGNRRRARNPACVAWRDARDNWADANSVCQKCSKLVWSSIVPADLRLSGNGFYLDFGAKCWRRWVRIDTDLRLIAQFIVGAWLRGVRLP